MVMPIRSKQSCENDKVEKVQMHHHHSNKNNLTARGVATLVSNKYFKIPLDRPHWFRIVSSVHSKNAQLDQLVEIEFCETMYVQ